ncbi:RNA polymerase II-associated [Mucidula mucida]|nr:RNA polymerase II-associated [Mucidula mucida]
MSLKKSKLDLLVRVRYSNPLPAPPCPPKLLDIPTNPKRYARPELLNALANQTPLPMIVDAECGMPLDLSKWECLWQEGADDSELNPDPDNLPKLDPKDDFLAYDAAGPSTGAYTNGNTPSASQGTPLSMYPGFAKQNTQASPMRSSKNVQAPPIDVSHAAQIRDIEATFVAANQDFSLKNLRHPTKPKLTAIESYEVLPDIDIWPNQYDLFRFSERPGERALDMEDPRLDCAILRPMKSEHDSFLSYYLTPDDKTAFTFKENRSKLQPYEKGFDDSPLKTEFRFVRDYETVKVEQEVPNEFLLVLNDGSPSNDMEDSQKRRMKGAYYKNIERKMTLKKKRAKIQEKYPDKWDVIQMQYCDMDAGEVEERDEALAEVIDPMYMMRGEADADADAEDDPLSIPTGNGADVVMADA